MDQWRVDAEGVLGVLTGVDAAGPDFESAHRKIEEAAASGSAVSLEGRTALSSAWDAFLAERSLVPGKVMHAVSSAAAALTEATAAVVAGDEQMTADTDGARRRAEEWGIDSPDAYSASAGEK